MTTVQQVEQLKSKLVTTIDEQNNVVNMGVAVEVITMLETISISKDALEETRLGKVVNDLRKATQAQHPDLSARCRQLIREWQRMANISSGQSSSGVSPAITPRTKLTTPTGLIGRGISPRPPHRVASSPALSNNIHNIFNSNKPASPALSSTESGPIKLTIKLGDQTVTPSDTSAANGASRKRKHVSPPDVDDVPLNKRVNLLNGDVKGRKVTATARVSPLVPPPRSTNSPHPPSDVPSEKTSRIKTTEEIVSELIARQVAPTPPPSDIPRPQSRLSTVQEESSNTGVSSPAQAIDSTTPHSSQRSPSRLQPSSELLPPDTLQSETETTIENGTAITNEIAPVEDKKQRKKKHKKEKKKKNKRERSSSKEETLTTTATDNTNTGELTGATTARPKRITYDWYSALLPPLPASPVTKKLEDTPPKVHVDCSIIRQSNQLDGVTGSAVPAGCFAAADFFDWRRRYVLKLNEESIESEQKSEQPDQNRLVLALPYVDIGLPDFIEHHYVDRQRFLAFPADNAAHEQ